MLCFIVNYRLYKICGAFELTVRGHNQTEESNNSGVFCGLINFSADLDNALRENLERPTVFKGLPKIYRIIFCSVCLKNVEIKIN